MTYDITDNPGNLPVMTEAEFQVKAEKFVEDLFNSTPPERRLYVYFKDAAELKAAYYAGFRKAVDRHYVIVP